MINAFFSRRRFLGTAAALGALPLLPKRTSAKTGFRLTPKPAAVNIVGSEYPNTDVWAYDGLVPGPEIRVRQGDTVRVDVTNGLAEPTTVHWHGLRLPNAMDGVPELTQAPIKPGESFTYEFEAVDAGTFWYHPHVRTSEQLGRGLYGPLIVEEPNPPKVDRDVTWVIDDWRLTKEAAIADNFGNGMDMSHGGRTGNAVTINGKLAESFSVRSAERIRLRLINTANARIFGLDFGNHTPTVIALDGHPVTPHTPADNIVTLGSGQRADLILDCVGDPGTSFDITDVSSRRFQYTFVTMRYDDAPPVRTSPLDAPIKLADNPLAVPDLANAQSHDIVIEGGAMGRMDGATFKGNWLEIRDLAAQGKIWALNGIAAHGMKMDPLLTLKQGATHIIRLQNQTGWPHPMHLHGHAFRILSRNGKPEPHTPWADTVLLGPQDTAELALVADNPGDWLFHCHILEHHAAGMAAVVRVT